MPQESSSALALVPRSIARVARAELPKYLTRDQVQALLSACGRPRDRLALRVMWETGVRVSELTSLASESIDFTGEALQVVTLKRRGHVRAVPVRPALLGELARHIAAGGIGAGKRLFPVTRQRVHQVVSAAARSAGLPADRAHPHTPLVRDRVRPRACPGPGPGRVARPPLARIDARLHQGPLRRQPPLPRRRRLRIAATARAAEGDARTGA